MKKRPEQKASKKTIPIEAKEEEKEYCIWQKYVYDMLDGDAWYDTSCDGVYHIDSKRDEIRKKCPMCKKTIKRI